MLSCGFLVENIIFCVKDFELNPKLNPISWKILKKKSLN